MTAKVAICMAVYDDERYLALTLDALCAQSFRDFHLTVYDDGSHDRSAELAEAYQGRLPLRVVRGGHLGRQAAKHAARRESAAGPYLMVLDSDIVLPPDGLRQMVDALDADPQAAAVSARYRAFEHRPLGLEQAFIDDVFFARSVGAAGEGRWIVGGCVLFRRAVLDEVPIRDDLGEDHDLSEKLRARWRLLMPRGLVVTHYGVPVSLGGTIRRFAREGIRVAALHRAYPSARQAGAIARLVPLPLLLVLLAAAATRHWTVAIGTLGLFVAYVIAFVMASGDVPATVGTRVRASLLFTIANLGYGAGYLRELLNGGRGAMREPRRSA